MRQRIITGVALGAVILVVMMIGGVAVGLTAMLTTGLSVWEEYKALRDAGHRPIEWPTWTAAALAVPVYYLWGIRAFALLVVIAAMVTLGLVMFRRDPKLEDALVSLLPLLSIVLPGLCLVSIAFIQPIAVQRIMVLMAVAVPVAGDTAAYFVGSFLRGPKLCPAISPNKTVSGALGGLAGSLLMSAVIGVIAYFTCRDMLTVILPHWGTYGMLGILGGVAAQLGDLFASMVKRHCGIKDYSSLFPGHGGMLDRMDSVLFMAVIVFCVCLMGSRF